MIIIPKQLILALYRIAYSDFNLRAVEELSTQVFQSQTTDLHPDLT
jgi:hypothetical protein